MFINIPFVQQPRRRIPLIPGRDERELQKVKALKKWSVPCFSASHLMTDPPEVKCGAGGLMTTGDAVWPGLAL